MNKYVLITGGSRGIGAATVRKFAQNGYNVIFTYVNSKDLANSLVQEIERNYNVKCYAFQCDIGNEDSIKSLLNNVKDITNSLDSLINNAGIAMDKSIDDKSVTEFSHVINVNLTGTYAITKYFYKMINLGSIVIVASNDGIDSCYKDEMDYAASKAGVISLTKTMAKEFAPNIRVNAVAPGWVETDMSKNDINDNEIQYEKDLILLRRFAKPEEIANVIWFLCGDEASYINGEIIKVDGGY